MQKRFFVMCWKPTYDNKNHSYVKCTTGIEPLLLKANVLDTIVSNYNALKHNSKYTNVMMQAVSLMLHLINVRVMCHVSTYIFSECIDLYVMLDWVRLWKWMSTS